MAIFKITKENAKAIKSKRRNDFFESEFELRDFFKKNLEQLLGVRFLEKEYPITEARIDTLGIDDDNSPVIIEYKWDKDDKVLTQGLDYYGWLQENRRPFQDLVKSKLGNDIEVNWDQPRVILVAQDFSRQIKRAVRQIEYVELVTYACYEPDILHLDGIEMPDKKIVTSVVGESGSTEVYDKNYHFSLLRSEAVKEKAETLRQRIRSLPEVEELIGQKTGISYKSNRKFVRFSFYPSYLEITLKEPKYLKDTKRIVKDITSYKFGWKGRINFKDKDEVDYVFEVIKEAYDQTR